jgi:hypothetical protein
VCAELHDSRELLHTPADLAVGRVAARQGGVVSVAQLHAAGLGRGAIHARARAGRLVRVHRGVYAVGHAQLTAVGWRWAAVLACGGPSRAALSHQSAAVVWDLLPSPAKFDVTTLGAAHGTASIRVHRGALTANDITTIDGLPLTTVARTLVDLATTLTPHQTERVVHRAEHLRLLDTRSLDEQLARAQGRPTRKLRAALRTLGDQRARHHPHRSRGAVPRPHPQCAVTAARGQRARRRLRSRLPLARREAHRRDRRRRHPPDGGGLRRGSAEGRRPLNDGVQNPPLHLAAGCLRARLRGQGHSHSTRGVASRLDGR